MFWGALSHLNCLKILVLPTSLGNHFLLLAWVVEICICQLQEVLHLQNLKGWHDISLQNYCHTQTASITRRSQVNSSFKLILEHTTKVNTWKLQQLEHAEWKDKSNYSAEFMVSAVFAFYRANLGLLAGLLNNTTVWQKYLNSDLHQYCVWTLETLLESFKN